MRKNNLLKIFLATGAIVLGLYQNCAPLGYPTSIQSSDDPFNPISEDETIVPLFLPPGLKDKQHTLVKITNNSNQSGNISISIFNNTGETFGPFTFNIEPNASIYFKSDDLKGLLPSFDEDQFSNLGFLWLNLNSNEINISFRSYFINIGEDPSLKLARSLYAANIFFQVLKKKIHCSYYYFCTT